MPTPITATSTTSFVASVTAKPNAEEIKQKKRDALAKARQAKADKKAIKEKPAPVYLEKKTNGKHEVRDWDSIDWHEIPFAEGNLLLGDLQRMWEHAAKVMQQRQVASDVVQCACGCNRTFPPSHACMSMARRDPKTLLPYNVYFATQECVRQHNRKTMGIPAGVEALPR